MPTPFMAGPERSGKTSVAGGLLAWLWGAGRSAAYDKPFSADVETDADHAFASGTLADGLDIAVGPAPRALSAPFDAGFNDLLRCEAEGIIVEVTEGSISSELAGALDARVLEVHAYAAGQVWPAEADRATGRWGNRLAALVVNTVPPYHTSDVATSVAESAADVAAVVVPDSRVMLALTEA